MSIDGGAVPLRPQRVVHATVAVPFSASIVWHCLVDPELVDGWLGHALVDAVPEGRFAIVWPTGEPHAADWFGTITVLDEPRRLRLAFRPHTSIEFVVTPAAAPNRGSTITVSHESFFTAPEDRAVHEFWRVRLDYLVELLRGRPVDWSAPGRE